MSDIMRTTSTGAFDFRLGHRPLNPVDSSVYHQIDKTLSRVQQMLEVDFLALLIPSDDGQTLLTVSGMGYDPALTHGFQLPLQETALNQLRPDLDPMIVEDPADSAALSPLLRLPDIGEMAIVPLALDGELRGILHVGTHDAHGIQNGPASLLQIAGHMVALAVDRAELQQAEEQARHKTEDTRERLTFLAIASGLLSSSLDYETTLSQITGMLVPRLADICAVVLLDKDGTANEVTTYGVNPEITSLVRELQTRFTLMPGSHSTIRRVLDSGKTEFIENLTDKSYRETASNDEHLNMLRRLGMRSMVIVPLIGRGETIGALSVAYVGSSRHYSLEDVDFIEELAHRATLAVENARLFQESQRALEDREESLRFREETIELERAARARAEAAQQREAFLSEASSVLSASLDSAATLENLGRLVVDQVADWFTIELFDEGGTSELTVASHADSNGRDLLRRIRDEYVPVTITELPPRHILRYREPMLVNGVPPEFWFDSATTPQLLILMNQLESSALIVVPLFVRDETLGVMILGRSGEQAEFDAEDLPMAIDLGYRIALAIDNSRLYYRAQHILQQQEEFISTASHELKTPLTTVKGYLQLINRQLHREDQSPERIVRFTRELEEQVRRLEDLVSDLLDVSRIQQGRLELRLEQFDLAELAANVLSRFEHAPERSGNHELVLDVTEPIIGIWDRGRIDQVLTNLVSNALKYSPKGGEVVVHLRRRGDHAKIAVRDSGIGITPEDRATLFQPFARGKTSKGQISGTGLGLYITQRIVQNHNGSILVKSEPGRGTTFTVRLPLETDTQAE